MSAHVGLGHWLRSQDHLRWLAIITGVLSIHSNYSRMSNEPVGLHRDTYKLEIYIYIAYAHGCEGRWISFTFKVQTVVDGSHRDVLAR